MASGELRIGEVASRSGVSIDTVRYYERRLLLPPAPRTAGGFRLFTRETVARVQFNKQAQELGLSLDEIKAFLVTGGAKECRRVRDLLRAKLTDVAERIRLMEEFRQTLSHHLAACEQALKEQGDGAECPVMVNITIGITDLRATVRKRKKR
jgi:DNA-binding transcriptional MerR regulator